MATREELVDAIAGFALFADLDSTRSCWASPTCSRRSSIAEGERVLRQGLTGSGFYVILDGDGGGRHRRHRARHASPAATSSARSPSCSASRRSPTSSRRARCAASSWPAPAVEPFLLDHPPVMYRMLQAQARRLRNANRWRSCRDARAPLPAGRLPGRRRRQRAGRPPGLVRPPAPRRRARRHLGRRRPGRHVPALAVLPAAAVVDQAVRAGRARHARLRALRLEQPPRATSRSAGAPARASWTGPRTSRRGRRWRQNLEAFAERAGDPRPLRLPLERTRREEGPDGDHVRRRDDRRRVPLPACSSSRSGVAEPSTPPTPGIELARHYADTRAAETYAGKRVFIIGKQNSGFELASGLAPWASSITVCSPSPARTSVDTKSLVGVRARYVQPFEDPVLGGGVAILDASITGLDGRRTAAIRVDLRRTDDGGGDVRRGRRGHRRDRLHLPAARPAGPRRRDVRGEPAAGPDAVLGERDRARHLLRRHDRPGGAGASRSTACRPTPAPSTAPATTP